MCCGVLSYVRERGGREEREGVGNIRSLIGIFEEELGETIVLPVVVWYAPQVRPQLPECERSDPVLRDRQ